MICTRILGGLFLAKCTIVFCQLNETKIAMNFCPRLKQVTNKEITFAQALIHTTIRASISYDSPSYLIKFDNNGQPVGGYIYHALEMISKSGNFQFEYVIVPKLSSLTTTQQLSIILDSRKVDLASDMIYTDSAGRRALGYGFTQHLADNSAIFVTTQPIPNVALFWSFSIPFSNTLWIVLIGLIILNGGIHHCLERLRLAEALETIYRSFGSFTGGQDSLSAQSKEASVLICGFCFLMMIVRSTYTANLASLLTSYSQLVPSLSSIDEAQNQGALVCVLDGTASAAVVHSMYPKVKTKVLLDHHNDFSLLLKSIVAGTCQGAVLPASYFEFVSHDQRANPYCNIVQAGTTLAPASGAWTFKNDYSKYCTSFGMDALSEVITSLRQSGALNLLFLEEVSKYSNLKCPDLGQGGLTITFPGLYGAFIIYGCCLVGSLCWANANKVGVSTGSLSFEFRRQSVWSSQYFRRLSVHQIQTCGGEVKKAEQHSEQSPLEPETGSVIEEKHSLELGDRDLGSMGLLTTTNDEPLLPRALQEEPSEQSPRRRKPIRRSLSANLDHKFPGVPAFNRHKTDNPSAHLRAGSEYEICGSSVHFV